MEGYKYRLNAAIQSLLSDISDMRAPGASKVMFFGPFSNGRTIHHSDGADTYIEWPNLDISAKKLADLLVESP